MLNSNAQYVESEHHAREHNPEQNDYSQHFQPRDDCPNGGHGPEAFA